MPRTVRLLAGALLACAVAAGHAALPSEARAQEAGRIAAVVNDEPVTVLDLEERIALILALSGVQNTPDARDRLLPEVLRKLIDERLARQEARALRLGKIVVDFDDAYAVVERNIGLAPGQLAPFLAANGLSAESLNGQIEAELLWNDLVSRRMSVEGIGPERVDEELERLRATIDEPSYRLAEIFVAVDIPAREAEVEAGMWRLREALLDGADFRALARQFSQGSGRNQGGDLGWIAQSQLSDELAAVAPSMRVGEVSQPVRVAGGFALIALTDRRGGAQDDEIVVRQATIATIDGDETATVERAGEAVAAVGSCDDLDALAGQPHISVSPPLNVRLGDLQPALQEIVAPLSANETSAPVATPQGAIALTLCSRSAAAAALPSRDEILQRLRAEQHNHIGRSYLRDLRHAAFVDIRL